MTRPTHENDNVIQLVRPDSHPSVATLEDITGNRLPRYLTSKQHSHEDRDEQGQVGIELI